MKKQLLLFISALLCTCNLWSSNVQAASIYEKGITNEGITYITYDLSPHSSINPYASYIRHTMETVYDGIVTPPSTLTVTKSISGVVYTGTLYLQSHKIENNKTYATYYGTLYAVE